MRHRLPPLRLDRRGAACVAALALLATYSIVLVPVAPVLLGRDPVLLEALRASVPAMVAGGAFARVGEASPALALLAPVPTLVMADPFLWWAGRLWGPPVARFLGGHGERGRRRTERAVDVLRRGGAWAVLLSRFLPVPTALIYAAAGWNGMRLRHFLALDLAGTAAWAGMLVGLGYALGHPAVRVAEAITRSALLLSVAAVAITLAAMGIRRLARRSRRAHPVAR